MLAKENGVKAASVRYFFTPTEEARANFYYITICGHFQAFSGYDINRKFHPNLLLLYVKKGRFHLRYERQALEIGEDEYILIDCRLQHHYYVDDYCEFYFIHFDGADAHKLWCYIDRTAGFYFKGRQYDYARKTIMKINSIYANGQSLSIPECSSMLYSMMCVFLADQGLERLELELPEGINEAVQLIRNRSKEALTVGDLAEAAGMSTSHFARRFKTALGVSPYEYIIRVRLDRAKYLLETTEMNVEQIAYETGFNSPNRFTNSFTQNIGVAPNQYRKLVKS